MAGKSGRNTPSKKAKAAAPKRHRRRNVIYYNPPWNSDVKSNVGGTFLYLMNKHFPSSSSLHSLFNKNNFIEILT